MVFILLLALDVSALSLLLPLVFEHPLITTLLKFAPLVGGAALVTYFDGLRKSLLAWTSRPWLRVVSVLLLPLAVLQVLPYHMPIVVDLGTTVSIDNAPAFVPEGLSKRFFVSGFGDHELTVTQRDGGRLVNRSQTFHVTRWELLRSTGRALALRTRWDTARVGGIADVVHKADQIEVALSGQLPELYLADAAFRNRVSESSGRKAVHLLLERGHVVDTLVLPVGGPWGLSVRTSECWSKPESVYVHLDSQPSVDLSTPHCDTPSSTTRP